MRRSNQRGSWLVLADYDADGRADIAWRHVSGAMTIWLMDGTHVIGGGPAGMVDPMLRLVHNGDYDGDGKADLLWRSDAGSITMWFMNGSQVFRDSEVATVDPAWQIVYTR